MDFSSKKIQMALAYLISYVSSIGNPMILPCLPFIMEEFSLSPLEMGLLISLYALPGIFIIPLYGFLSDRLGRKPLLILALILCCAGSLLCTCAPSFEILLLGRALQGLSITPLESLSTTLASDLFEGEERMRMVTRTAVVQYFGVATVPITISCILLAGNWRMTFIFGAVLGLSALVFCLPVKLAYSTSSQGNLALYKQHLKEMLSSRRVLSLFSVRALNSFILFGVVYTHFPLLLAERAPESNSLLGLAYSIYAIGMFTGALLTRRVNERFGATLTGFIGGTLTTSALLIFLFMQNIETGLLAMALVGLGIAVMNTSCVGHVSLATTPDTKGSIMSAYSTIFRAGQTLAPILCGLCFQFGGCSGLFGTASVFSLVLMFWAATTFGYAARIERLERLS